MKHTTWITTLLLSTSLGLAYAQPSDDGASSKRRRGPPPLHMIIERQAEALEIDAATVAEIRSVAESRRAELDLLHQTMRAARSSGDPMLIVEAKAQLAAAELDVTQAIHAILGADRWQALVEHMGQHKKPRRQQW